MKLNCKDACSGWARNSAYYFKEVSKGCFGIYGKAGHNTTVTHCPWCGAQLIDKEAELKEELRTDLGNIFYNGVMKDEEPATVIASNWLMSKYNITKKEGI